MTIEDRIKEWRGQSREEEIETDVDLLADAELALRSLRTELGNLVSAVLAAGIEISQPTINAQDHTIRCRNLRAERAVAELDALGTEFNYCSECSSKYRYKPPTDSAEYCFSCLSKRALLVEELENEIERMTRGGL